MGSEVNAVAEVQMIPVEWIAPGDNDRQVFQEAALAELAESIRAHGLAQPITVRPVGGRQARYEIVAGERRFRAIRDILRWPAAPCLVREMSDEEASAIMLAENTGRKDLNPIEEARAYQKRIQQFGWSVERVAEVAGVSAQLVRQRLSLLGLVPEAQKMVAHGHLPLSHAEALVGLDVNRQRIALRALSGAPNLSLVAFRELVGRLLEEQSQEALFSLSDFFVQQVAASVQEEGVPWGPKAIVHAPVDPELPEVEADPRDLPGNILDAYIRQLLAAGFHREACAVGNVYRFLVRHRKVARAVSPLGRTRGLSKRSAPVQAEARAA
jgi:ParB/RepB/Spo0J family partition protein